MRIGYASSEEIAVLFGIQRRRMKETTSGGVERRDCIGDQAPALVG